MKNKSIVSYNINYTTFKHLRNKVHKFYSIYFNSSQKNVLHLALSINYGRPYFLRKGKIHFQCVVDYISHIRNTLFFT